VRGRLALWLLAIGALGGFQGAIGWVMVASGLREGMLAVAPIKLTLHLTTACLILTALLYTLRRLTPRPAGDPAPAGAAFRSKLLLALVIVQIALGGLVAGSKAGMIYDTWPLMDGRLIPPAAHLFRETPWIENFVDNVTLVQFNHRMTAYLLLALALWHWLAVRRAAPGSRHAWGALHMVLAILVQAGVGILTLIWNVPLAMALLHQLFGVLILVSAVIHAERLGRAGEAHSAPKHQAASA
jgi:cytochrome c oxidase assembly protein subunit 15